MSGPNSSNSQPTAAAKSIRATKGQKGRFGIRVKFVEGMDCLFPGQVFHVANAPEKSVRFLSTTMSHGDADSANWFMVMHVEPINCEPHDLDDVFLVSFQTKVTTTTP
jgi:hypothetical protein